MKRINLLGILFLLLFTSCENIWDGQHIREAIDDAVAAANSDFKVVATYPTYTIEGIYFDSPIEIHFSNPINPDFFSCSIEINNQDAREHFLDPIFVDDNKIVRFLPDMDNPVSMENVTFKDVTVTVYGDTVDKDGKKLFTDFKWTYRINSDSDSIAPVWEKIFVEDSYTGRQLSNSNYRNWTEDDLRNYRSAKVKINVQGNDIGTGVKKLLVTETRLTQYANGSVVEVNDVVAKDVECSGKFVLDNYGAFVGNFSYDLAYNQCNGISKIDFYLVDGNYNRSPAKSFYVLSTTKKNYGAYIFNEPQLLLLGSVDTIFIDQWNDRVRKIYFGFPFSDFKNDYYKNLEERYDLLIQWGSSPDDLKNSSRDFLYIENKQYTYSYSGNAVMAFEFPSLNASSDTYAKITILDGAGNSVERKFIIPGQASLYAGYSSQENINPFFSEWICDKDFLEMGNITGHEDINGYSCYGFWTSPASVDGKVKYLGKIKNGETVSSTFSDNGIYVYLANKLSSSYQVDIYGAVEKKYLLPVKRDGGPVDSIVESCTIDPIREKNSGKCKLKINFDDSVSSFSEIHLVGQSYENLGWYDGWFNVSLTSNELKKSVEKIVPNVDGKVRVKILGYKFGMGEIVLDEIELGNPMDIYDNVPLELSADATYSKIDYVNGSFVKYLSLKNLRDGEVPEISMWVSRNGKKYPMTGAAYDSVEHKVCVPVMLQKQYPGDFYWIRLEDGNGNFSENVVESITLFDSVVTQSHMKNYGLYYSAYSEEKVLNFKLCYFSGSDWDVKNNESQNVTNQYYFNSGASYSDLKEKFIKIFPIAANAISSPKYFWSGESNDVKFKQLYCGSNNEYCVVYDNACLVQTFYSPVNFGSSIDEWEIFGMENNPQKKMPGMIGQPELFVYTTKNIPLGNYYVVVARFADGSYCMSNVLQKKYS